MSATYPRRTFVRALVDAVFWFVVFAVALVTLAAAYGVIEAVLAPTAHAGPLASPPLPAYSTTVEPYVVRLPDIPDPVDPGGWGTPIWDVRVASYHGDALTCEVCWACRPGLDCCGARRVEAGADVSYGTTTVKGALRGAEWRCWDALGAGRGVADGEGVAR